MIPSRPMRLPRGAILRSAAVLLAAGLIPCAAWAQADTSGGTLSLEEAVRHAVGYHPSVTASTLAVAEARAAVGEESAARLPAVMLAGSAFRYQEPMLVTPIHGLTPGLTPPFDETLIQGGAKLSYTLFDGGARGSRVRQARSRAEGASAGQRVAEQSLVARVVAAYANVLTQRQVAAATDRRLEALRAERTRADQRVAAGRGAELEVLRADAAVAEAEAARVRVAAAREVGERDLARLTGWSPERVRGSTLAEVAAVDQEPGSRGLLVARALESNPALDQARQQQRTAEAGVSVVRGARLPDLKLIGAYLDRGSASGDFKAEWNAGVQLSFPLFTGGALSSRVRRAEAARGASAEQVRLVELRVSEEIDGALARVDEVRARVEALRRAEASLAEVARIEKLALEAGAGTQTDYLKAEADLLAVSADLAAARNGQVVAWVELARATGDLSPAWVAGNVESKP